MDLLRLCSKEARLIDREIAKQLPRKMANSHVSFLSGKVRFAHDGASLTGSISIPAWNFLDRGGKRCRPVLLLAVSEALGGERKTAMRLTPVPELIHNGCVTANSFVWKGD